MKKRLILLLLPAVALLLAPCALAAELGVYVAPKFIYAYTAMDKVAASTPGVTPVGPATDRAFQSDDAFGGALAVGYNFDTRFGVPVRAELEYAVYSRVEGRTSGTSSNGSFTDSFGTKQKMDIQTLFLNAYYDIKTGSPLTPYVGGGIGAAFVESRSSSFYGVDGGGGTLSMHEGGTSARRNNNFAWNAGAGIGWKVTEPLTVDLGYRFVYLGEVKSKDWSGARGEVHTETDDVYMHQVTLGLRYEF